MLAAIIGLSGPALTEDERAFIREADPAGFILFGRNVSDKAQLRALTDSLRELSGRTELPILIDQEGGRVARLAPPEWPAFPAAWRFAELYEKAPISAIEAARANGEALALILAEVGINVDCAPVLDLRQEGAHDVIGDRAYGAEPMRVAALGRATLEGLRVENVVGVVKHVPGHGRASADSHVALPTVTVDTAALERDLAPFRRLADAPMAMTAHVVYTAWDAERCASLSPVVIGNIIRGEIGFDGLLMSDDLGMHALQGGFGERTAGVLAAGCDIALHCSGEMDEMTAVAGAVGAIAPAARARLDRAMATIGTAVAKTERLADLLHHRDELLALADGAGREV
jgi:beta-N-acetylhexosaminidase